MKLSDLITPEQDARYIKNQQKGETPCQLCGRPLTTYDHYLVEDYQTGDLIPKDSPELENPSQYNPNHCVLYIGSECVKRTELKPYRMP